MYDENPNFNQEIYFPREYFTIQNPIHEILSFPYEPSNIPSESSNNNSSSQTKINIINTENLFTTKKLKNNGKNNAKLLGENLYCTLRSNNFFKEKKYDYFKNDEEKIKDFDNWLDRNFDRKLTSKKLFAIAFSMTEPKEKVDLFKELSRIYFRKFAIKYIINSKIERKESKESMIKNVHKFLDAVDNPKYFY